MAGKNKWPQCPKCKKRHKAHCAETSRVRNPVDSSFSTRLGSGLHSRVYGSGDVVQVVTRPDGKSVDMSKLVLWAARNNLPPALAAYLPDVEPIRAECHGRKQRDSEFIYTMPLYDTAVSTGDATWDGVREVLYSASDRSGNLRQLVTLIEGYSFRRPPAVRARCLAVADTLREVEAVAARMYAEALEVRGRPFQRYREARPDLTRNNVAMDEHHLLLLDPIVATLPVKDARSLWFRWTGLRVQRNDCTPPAERVKNPSPRPLKWTHDTVHDIHEATGRDRNNRYRRYAIYPNSRGGYEAQDIGHNVQSYVYVFGLDMSLKEAKRLIKQDFDIAGPKKRPPGDVHFDDY